MSDPLSIAASIAGLLCLAGTASKSIFQFISSIADAPEQARHLTRELYALNVALGQVQGNILDPRFSIENDNDENVRMLHECLASCMAVYSELESRLRNAGLAKESSESRSIGIIQRSWKSFKWSFTDGELGELLRRVDAEKATLGLINNAFAAKLAAGILGSLKETEGQIRQMNRRLKNVQVVLEWMVHNSCQQNSDRDQESSQQTPPMISPPEDLVESSVFNASYSYGPNEIANLMRSTGSVLSLTLETNLDDTVTVQWSPAEAAIPRRLSAAEIRQGMPRLGTDEGWSLFESTEILLKRKAHSRISRLAEGISRYTDVLDVFNLSQPLRFLTQAIQGNERCISDVSALQDRYENVISISENLENTRVVGRRNAMEEVLREYDEYLQRVFSKRAGVRGIIKSNLILSDEYEGWKKGAFDAVTSFEAFINAQYMAESLRYQKEQAAASQNQMELHRKIDTLSEKISRLETSKPIGDTGSEEAGFQSRNSDSEVR